MNLMLSIIDDLYAFVLRTTCAVCSYGKRSFTEVPAPAEPIDEVAVATVHPPVDLPEPALVEEEEPTFTPVGDILKSAAVQKTFSVTPVAATVPLRNTVMYVAAERTPLFKHPAYEYDSVVTHLSFGDMVMVLESRDHWVKVSCREHEGWMAQSRIALSAGIVYPQFIVGTAYDAHHEATQRLRAMIKDEFGCGDAELPLQAGEYVAYRLLRKGITIPWPDIRPRMPGMWHSILRGRIGIHVGVVPKTGAVMEYTLEQNIGHVAYIESVLPDNTITISEANWKDNGIFNERTLTEEEWQALAPLFIQIS